MNNKEKASDQKNQQSQKGVGYWQLFRYTTGGERGLIAVAILMSAFQGGMMPLFSVAYGKITEDFTPTSTKDEIKSAATTTAIYMILIGVATFIFCFLGSFLWAYVGGKIVIRVKQLYFSNLLDQEMGWFDVVSPEKLTISYVEDMQKFKEAVGFNNHITIASYGTTILGFVVGYIHGWWFSLIVTLTFPVLMIGMVAFVAVNQKEARVTKIAYETAGGASEQALAAIKTIKALGGEDHEVSIYADALEQAKKVSIKYGFLAAFCYGLFMFCMTASFGLNYWLGAILVEKSVYNGNVGRAYNVKDIITVFFAIVNGGFALGQTSPALKAIGMGRGAAAAIYAIIERVSQIPQNSTDGERPMRVEGEIEFRNVHFSYPSRPDSTVLRGLNLTIPKGKKVALVGETGCGKSTTIQMIERYYDPLVGDVLIDGKNIKDYNMTSLRKFIGYVGQEPVLFATTIRENLLVAKPTATETEIVDALKKANAYSFIEQLEKKLDTYVGSGGSQLSGGQKQRISIARSILQDPTILLLDEATSALDHRNEREIQDTLDKFARNRTTVTIAHRLSTVINSDIIFVFDKGVVVEQGSHEELIQKEGIYKKLVTIQLKGLQVKEDPKLASDPNSEPADPLPLDRAHLSQRLSQMEVKEIELEAKEAEQVGAIDLEPSKEAKLDACISQEKKAREEEEKNKKLKAKLNVYIKKHYLLFLGGCIFALAGGCVMPLFALFLADMLTALSNFELLRLGFGAKYHLTWDGNKQEVERIALSLLVVALFGMLTNFIQLSFFNSLSQKVTTSLRRDLYKHFLTRDIEFFDDPKHSPGELSSVLSKECIVVNSVVSTSYGAVLTGVGSFACGVTIAFVSSWRIALISLALTPLIFATGVIKTSKMKTKVALEVESFESKAFQETVTNMRTVLALNAASSKKASFDRFVEEENKVTHRSNSFHASLEAMAQFTTFIVYGIIFYAGAEFTLNNGLSFQNMFRGFMGIVFAAYGASMGQQFAGNLGAAEQAAATIFGYMEIQNKVLTKPDGLKTPIQGEIEFRNVKFTYPQRRTPCFLDLSFKILPKQKAAFAGPSGTGKSTIFSLLYRFYDPDSGSVLVDGVDVKDYDLQHLRHSLGMVSQEPTLFNESIRYNIKYNKPEITEEEVKTAVDIANATKFIMNDQEAKQEGSFRSPQARPSTSPTAKASTEKWACAATSCPAARNSASRLQGPLSATPASTCSTKPLRPWTPKARK